MTHVCVFKPRCKQVLLGLCFEAVSGTYDASEALKSCDASQESSLCRSGGLFEGHLSDSAASVLARGGFWMTAAFLEV